MEQIAILAEQVFKERNRQNTGVYIEDAFKAISHKFNECHSSDGTFCSGGGGGSQTQIKGALENLANARTAKWGFEPDFLSESNGLRRAGFSAESKPNSFAVKREIDYGKHGQAMGIATYDSKGKMVGTFNGLTSGANKGAFKISVREDAQRKGMGLKLLDRANSEGFDLVGSVTTNSWTGQGRSLMKSWLERKL